MVIDTSALVAIVLGEPSSPALLAALDHAATRELCSVSLLEAGIVLRARRGAEAVPSLYKLVEELGCELVPFGAA